MNKEISENKKEAIESLLEQGMKPEAVSEEVGCSLRYVYIVKRGMGTTIKEPSTKDNITEIRKHLKSVTDDIHKLAMSEEVFMILCPGCSEPFDLGYEESVVCQDCKILFCSKDCIKSHKETGLFDDESMCQEYKAKVSEFIGDDMASEDVGEQLEVRGSDNDDFW